jgi:hypothetical protein
MNRPRFRRALRITAFVVLFVGLAGFAVKTLWNALLPDIMGVSTITFWQALGLLTLSRILFGGFGRGPGGWHNYGKFTAEGQDFRNGWRRKMEERWQKMTPEQRAKMRQHWCDRRQGEDQWGNDKSNDRE